MARRSTLVKHGFEPGNEVFELVTEYKVHCCLESPIKCFVVGNWMKGNRCFTCCPRTITCLLDHIGEQCLLFVCQLISHDRTIALCSRTRGGVTELLNWR